MRKSSGKSGGCATVLAPEEFVRDLRAASRNVWDASVRCGIGYKFVKRIFDRKPVHARKLDAAMNCFYGRGGANSLAIGMRSALDVCSKENAKVLGMLQAAARIVDMFQDCLKVTMPHRKYWVFPPKDTLARLCDVCAECSELLKSIHAQMPELDAVIYKHAPGLLEKMKAEEPAGQPMRVDPSALFGTHKRTRRRKASDIL